MKIHDWNEHRFIFFFVVFKKQQQPKKIKKITDWAMINTHVKTNADEAASGAKTYEDKFKSRRK